jgi:uncharacterized protein (TIRG00374 family)
MKQARPTAVVAEAVARRLSVTGWLLLAFVLLLAVFIGLSGWQRTLDALARIGVAQFLFLCLLAGMHYLVRALRWHMLVRSAGVRTTLLRNALHFFGGFAMTATPGRLGELIRLRWLSRDTGESFGRLLPIALADRAIELASMVLLIATALAATRLGTGAVWGPIVMGLILVWIFCRPRLLEAIITGTWKLIGRRYSRLFVRLRRLTRRLTPFMDLKVFLPALAIGIVGWFLEGLAFWFLLHWLEVPISLATATAIFLVAILSGALSGLPGGFGGTEATAVALLLLQGVSTDLAILAIALIRIATLWFAVAIGLLVFPVAEMRSGAV